MKKKLYTAFLLFIAVCIFCSDAEANNRCLEKQLDKKHKQDTIKVEFENQFTLYWDCVNHKIIRDDNYYGILENKENVRAIGFFITDKKKVCNFVCSKKKSLKKGDVAYLFLSENGFVYEAKDLGEQFDVLYSDCRYPYGLLDYIEKNRNIVFKKVMSCINR